MESRLRKKNGFASPSLRFRCTSVRGSTKTTIGTSSTENSIIAVAAPVVGGCFIPATGFVTSLFPGKPHLTDVLHRGFPSPTIPSVGPIRSQFLRNHRWRLWPKPVRLGVVRCTWGERRARCGTCQGSFAGPCSRATGCIGKYCMPRSYTLLPACQYRSHDFSAGSSDFFCLSFTHFPPFRTKPLSYSIPATVASARQCPGAGQ